MAKQTLSLPTAMLAAAGISLVTGVLVLPGRDLSAVSQPGDGGFLEEIRAHRADSREQRRLYFQAMETCRDRRQQGQTIDCLSIKVNDPTTFQPFLTEAVSSAPSVSGASHAAAPELTVKMLSETDRSHLRRYQRVGTCPATLQDYLPGFYELCKRVIEETQLPLGRGRIDPAVKKRIPSRPVPHRVTANDVAEANKRPAPTGRIRVLRHEESHSSLENR